MHCYIIFAHPKRDSFTGKILDEFTKGLTLAGHKFEIKDLYADNFQSDMDLDQYNRETSRNHELPVPPDVVAEQQKINNADALIFVYPVWWSDCPAKLKGWFDRVWTLGYAYLYEDGVHLTSKINVKKAFVLCTAGTSNEKLEECGIAESMRKIMLLDRLNNVGIKNASMEILGGNSEAIEDIKDTNLKRAFELGKQFVVCHRDSRRK